jgi:adenosylcobinamide-GDP ribazoletransferase
MGRLFVEAMHGHAGNLKLISALAISLITATLLLRTVGMIAVAAGVAMALTVVWIAHRNINGVTGDVIGATNDLARMAALLSVVGATRLG